MKSNAEILAKADVNLADLSADDPTVRFVVESFRDAFAAIDTARVERKRRMIDVMKRLQYDDPRDAAKRDALVAKMDRAK